ncbi:PEP carboxykinase-like protein [Rhizoclosmatium globosum]|uniref:PEP carboxykinase-like protein n=1 Tax=Rhizoclosmatium globosum TaxID=329046 RepID=A0A1Y2D2L2_9FUNG|nr:PEP carboxykinase-like protein [Rhizoclosmatium globosum]|eukprot:ORY53533.1 PEP carboxykinase-like protein [Rhizoclosmatium globosum]
MLSNTSSNAPRTIETLCPRGFFCPYLDVSNPVTWPVYCEPSAECLFRRLGTGELCDSPQGYYEPYVCPGGFYCPTAKEIVVCPAGSYCLTGSSAPVKCMFGSYCPTGSAVEKHYGFLLLVVAIDVLIAAIFLFYRLRELKANNEPISALIPYALQKAYIDFSNRYLKKKEYEKTPTSEIDTRTLIPVQAIKNDTISKNISILTEGFKKGLEGHESLRMDFKFEGLSLKLATGKQILKGVSGEIKSGRMTAIMGPSGAGKTTFMNVLMGKVSRTDGTLRINDVVAEMEKYRKIIGYVPQDDIMIPELTVRENILYSARIRLPQTWSNKEVEDHVDSLLKALNLAHVANSRIGSTLDRGISGGQRKRVNIGLELAAAPLSIFLDEPTSGLDSTAALDAINIMSSISRLGLTIVAVIHQPRLEIFEAFDDVLMIAPGGLTAYIGPVDGVQQYFESLGFVFDSRLNPADVLMDILSGRGELQPGVPLERQHVSNIVQQWIQHSQSKEALLASQKIDSHENNVAALSAMSDVISKRGASFTRQVILAHNRSILQQTRLIGAFVMESFLGALTGLMIGMSSPEGEAYRGIFVAPFTLISGEQDAVYLALLGMINGIVIALVGAPPAVKVFGEEMAIYYREAAAGHNKLAYFIGKNISIIFRIAMAAAHFSAVYYLMSHPPINLGLQYGAMFLNFFGIYGLSMIVSMLVRRENAPLMGVTSGMILGVLCGFAPTIKEAAEQGTLWIYALGTNRWASEALFESWIEQYIDVFDTSIPNDHFGYELGRSTRNLLLMVVVALGYRVIAFILMVCLNRDKQK